ncbi:hypothetical protein B0I21_11153 [Sphingobacterium paludis]|uniref:Uncharacterized protein n=1 Tax=Sphingobacterium paludis TaxID=1476465 RepID=A0A4R7CRC3_9SPHI|nr:hypothetical protein B0I21_11153 [Sphingobacterium paludis]
MNTLPSIFQLIKDELLLTKKMSALKTADGSVRFIFLNSIFVELYIINVHHPD